MTTYYLDATLGVDAAAGTSTAAPWKTLAKLVASPPAAGDTVYLKRGEVWAEAAAEFGAVGTIASPVTFAAYGSGARPRIDGSKAVTPIAFYGDWAGSHGALHFRDITFSNGVDQSIKIQWADGPVTFTDCDFYGAGAVLLNCSGTATFTRCSFHDVNTDGAYIWNVPGIEFDSCSFWAINGATADCIQLTGNTGAYSSGAHIHDCHFDMMDTNSPKGCILHENGSTASVIEDNVCLGGNFGIALGSSDNVTVRRNVCQWQNAEAWSSGIYIADGDPASTATGHDIQDNVMVGCMNGLSYQASVYASTGITIAHKNIVRGLVKLGDWSGAAQSYPVPAGGDPAWRSAVLVQAKNGGAILAALKL
jgi:parallel beta-helix repeat protein